MADADQQGLEAPFRVAYLGPAGTFTEEAARLYAPEAQLLPHAAISAVAAALKSGEADEAVVAIENSLQGAVTDTLDLLIHEDGLFICRELALPIIHCLAAKPGTVLEKVRIVYSHPQALSQCRRFLERTFPQAELAASLSTAAAVEQVVKSPGVAAAIATRRAADLYGAQVMAEGIQDDPDSVDNTTRFVVLRGHDHALTGHDKTSICCSFVEDRPGQLYRVMGEFAQRNINLSKVESRPTRLGLGQYYFLIDLEGHRLDAPVREALERTGEMTSLLKVFGSYPRRTIYEYLERLVRSYAQTQGFVSTPGGSPGGTAEPVDVHLERRGERMAVDIAVWRTPSRMLQRLERHLADGYERAVGVFLDGELVDITLALAKRKGDPIRLGRVAFARSDQVAEALQ